MHYQKRVMLQLLADVTSEQPLGWCTPDCLAEVLCNPVGDDSEWRVGLIFNDKPVTVKLFPVEHKLLNIPPLPPLNLTGLQKQVADWATRNFQRTFLERRRQTAMGVVEEAGELIHHVLKQWQGIRGTTEEHMAEVKDAIGDILIYAMDLCSNEGWNMQEIAEKTAARVTKRDWNKDKITGGETE